MSDTIVMKAGDVVLDSLPFSMEGKPAQAKFFKDSGVKAIALYLGVAGPGVKKAALWAGLGVFAVTLAGEHSDGPLDELRELQKLGMPKGTSVFLDLEGSSALAGKPENLIAAIEAWALPINAAGYVAGLYAGVPQPLTSKELFGLKGITRYWKGQGRQVDRFNNLAEPSGCGWCLNQMYPSYSMGGVLVDANMVGQDYKGRTPVMAIV